MACWLVFVLSGGKTRTKDKYRMVYTDHQRLELEKEFHYSRYITIRRKAELATALSLSERQVHTHTPTYTHTHTYTGRSLTANRRLRRESNRHKSGQWCESVLLSVPVQVKIWFQNRRAKERKLSKRKLQLSLHAPPCPSMIPPPHTDTKRPWQLVHGNQTLQ